MAAIHELKTGDTIYFNSGQAHQMENAGANSAKVLCVAVPFALCSSVTISRVLPVWQSKLQAKEAQIRFRVVAWLPCLIGFDVAD